MAQSRWVFLGLAGTLLIASCGLALVMLLPEPRIHDEFSYLLQADTFAHGRLSNPPHPLWKHFETFHVIQQPTYASKFPPAQGLFLALGQILGHPILGVWISTALVGTSLFWMLSGLFPRVWALAGVAIAIFNPQLLLWNWNYWGGMVALLGGSLALGGFFRLLKRPEILTSALMGLGMGILCLSRPFEGFALTILLAAIGVFHFWKKRSDWKPLLLQVAIPAGGVILPVLLFQAYYNFRVTGSPLRMPYTVYEATHSQAPLFVWQRARPQAPQYSNPMMARLYTEYVDPFYYSQRTLKGFGQTFLQKMQVYSRLGWNGWFLVFLVPVIFVLKRDRRCRLVLSLLLMAFAVTFIGPVWALPHYSAPFFPLLVALMLFGLREVRVWRSATFRWGRWAARGIVLFFCIYGAVEFAGRQKLYQAGWPYQRAGLLAMLQGDGKKHLLIVRYTSQHNPHEEWVWNSADIDRAPVVWANDLGPQANQELLKYFKGYQTAIVEPDSGKVTALQ